VDHSTIHRWVMQYAPLLEQKFRQVKRKPCGRWRLDETYIKVKGEWKYYYRAVDRNGDTVDFLLTARRDKKAAMRYLKKAIGSSGKPSLINIDKSGANTAAIKQYNADESRRIKIRRCKYLNNIVEQVVRHSDHRLIKPIVKPMLGFKNFHCAQRALSGIELVRMLKKEQMRNQAGVSKTPAELFYALTP
jgi:putative transposase